MIYPVNGLQREIRVAIDQNMVSIPLSNLGDIDTLSLDDIIRSNIVDAVRVVEMNAPIRILGEGVPFGESIGWKSEVGIGCGYIHLPEDFMRLVSFQMSDWSRAVTMAIGEESPLYEIQTSRYPGIRGCPQKPVVAITQQPIGLVLEFYSCTSGEGVYVKRARYIPFPKIENEKIEFCDKIKPAVVHYAAYLTAMSVKDEDLAKSMLSISKDLMK